MARDNGQFTREDERLPRPPAGAVRDAVDEIEETDARLIDLENEEESPFLRGQKRVPVRRGPLPRRTARRVKIAAIVLLAAAVVGAVATVLYRYGAHSWRFRLESSSNLEIRGTHNVTRAQVLEVMGSDIGRNVFFVPLFERKKQLEDIAWVESASVMRLLPDRLRIEIKERTPVAFVQIGSRVSLIDASGVVMDMPATRQTHYSFPVITGMQESEPLSTRAARMKIYSALVRDLDSEGGNYSSALSEVDLSDPEDVKIIVPEAAGAVLIHMGSSEFLRRYKTFIAHVAEWRQQVPGQKLDSVDLRYEGQIIVNPDTKAVPAAQAPAPPAATRARGTRH
ncbi:MAG: FtsQ-type POTRA domain-containing protein [Acidobacteriia bacterium]|nr:FtsQ-type POTRA domain-containing protein [Terriglobia bacterium]